MPRFTTPIANDIWVEVGPGRHWHRASNSRKTDELIHLRRSTITFWKMPMWAAGPPAGSARGAMPARRSTAAKLAVLQPSWLLTKGGPSQEHKGPEYIEVRCVLGLIERGRRETCGNICLDIQRNNRSSLTMSQPLLLFYLHSRWLSVVAIDRKRK